MEEKRLLAAVALSLLVLYGYQHFFGPRPTPDEAVATATPSPSVRPSASGTPSPSPAEPEATPTPGPPEASAAGAVEAVAADVEKRVEVVAPGYAVAFTNRGARLLSWKLEKYRDARGQPEEMVPAVVEGPRPLDIETGDAETDARLGEALFEPSAEQLRVAAGREQTLEFRYASGDLEAEKVLTFRDGGFVDVSARVRREGAEVPCRIIWGPGLGNPSESERGVQGYQEPQGVALVDGSVERFPAKKLEAGGKALRDAGWVGVESRYFVALFVLSQGGTEARVDGVTVPVPGETASLRSLAAVPVPAGSSVQLYVGAKDYDTLRALGHGLERVVPVGEWIGPIAILLLRLLRWVHVHVGNWGWAIVLVTVLINVIMAPLRHYSIANGLKMAKLSPEMKAIQERYRKVPLMDPRRQQMQEEMGALYAKHGMSMGTQMMVGCLPLLITMPFLFAFYRVLTVSIELRGASFLWVPDLALKDPLFLTPIMMGVSMFTMQRMTPSTMDPGQQRIMMLMPVILAGMFMAAPAGLNLYWLTANLWSIFQQVVEMKVLRPRESPAPRKERKRK